MSKVTALTGSICANIEDEMVAACQGVAEKYGLSITRKGGGQFCAENFKTNIEVAVLDSDGTAQTQQVSDYTTYCHRYGLEEGDFGKVFVDLSSGDRYKIVGCKPRSTKYPLLVQKMGPGGKVYKFPADRVKRAFDAMAA